MHPVFGDILLVSGMLMLLTFVIMSVIQAPREMSLFQRWLWVRESTFERGAHKFRRVLLLGSMACLVATYFFF